MDGAMAEVIIERESVLEGGVEESDGVELLFKIRTASTLRHLSSSFGKLPPTTTRAS
jgi:hypothetical protein